MDQQFNTYNKFITKVLLLGFHFTGGKVEMRYIKLFDQGYTLVSGRSDSDQLLCSETLNILLLNMKVLSFLKR